jgi:Ca2+-binding EF-hand superfamily protein
MAPSLLSRWLRRAYRVLMYAYPPDFRRRYGREMEQVFGDRCRHIAKTAGLRGLLLFGAKAGADWLFTTIREGFDSVHVPAQASSAIGPALAAPVFYTCGTSMPRQGALASGAVLSLAIFGAVSTLIGHGGGRTAWRLIGSHHPGRSHLPPTRSSTVPPGHMETEVRGNPDPDESAISGYFRLIPVLSALDTDHDNIISAAEIAQAPVALRKLDKNHDGKLTAEECGARFGGSPGREFMHMHPVLVALDADHDGEISPSELERASAALATLDKNGDGQLTEDELLPDQILKRSNK